MLTTLNSNHNPYPILRISLSGGQLSLASLETLDLPDVTDIY